MLGLTCPIVVHIIFNTIKTRRGTLNNLPGPLSGRWTMNQLSTKAIVGLVLLALLAGATGSYFTTSYVLQSQPQPKAGAAVISSNLWLVTMNDTTANRALNTTYRNSENSGGQAMIVQLEVGLLCNGTGTAAAVNVEVNQTAAFLHNATRHIAPDGIGCVGGTNSTDNYYQVQVQFYVPWGMYYRVNSTSIGDGNASIQQWLESIPPTGFGLLIGELIAVERLNHGL